MMNKLITAIKTHIESEAGVWGIELIDLDTNEHWQHNHKNVFNAASVIKVPIMAAAFRAFEDKTITLSKKISLKREDQVGGSGVLQYLAPGTKLTIYDIITLMIIQSDNTATNMMIDLLGIDMIQHTMDKLELGNSTITNKLMIVSTDRKAPNQVTAEDMTKLLTNIAQGKVVSQYACNQMIDILQKQQINDCLPAELPDPDSKWIGGQRDWSRSEE